MSLAGELDIRAIRQSAPGANQQVVFNSGGVISASANLGYNIASNSVAAEANIQLSNQNSILFGGNQGNTANVLFQMSYNASTNSVDVVFV